MADHLHLPDPAKLKAEHLFPKLGKWYFATASGRMEPSFFIIGVQKGGTSSLAQYFTLHPDVITPQRKDVYFFNNIENYNRGIDWYKAHFAHRFYKQFFSGSKNAVTFDPTPNYFSADGAAERLHKHYPKAKLILLLRNPVERAWSNYRMCKWHGFEELSFEDALKVEDARLQTDFERTAKSGMHSYVAQRLAYRTHGLYAKCLRQWYALFPKEQILILKSEDLFENPGAIFSDALNFLGLSPAKNIEFENANKGKLEKEMNPETRKQLADFYAPHNQELYALIQRDMNWR